MGKSLNLLKTQAVSIDAGIEDNGDVAVAATVTESLGGGQAAGIASFESANKLKFSAEKAADLGLLALESKFPTMAGAIETFRTLMDAEITKLAATPST